jgi:hypothetical protein
MTVSRLEEYEASLPDGLGSYPKCQHKAAFFCDFLEHVPFAKHAHRLPKPLRYLVEQPVRPSTWLPEVHTNALYLATCDFVFQREEELGEVLYEVNKRVLSTPINRVMFMVVSTPILLSAAGARWSPFHRGSQMKTARHGERGSVELAYPKHLFPKLMLQVYERIFQAIFDLSTIRAEVRLVTREASSAKYDIRWGHLLVEQA